MVESYTRLTIGRQSTKTRLAKFGSQVVVDLLGENERFVLFIKLVAVSVTVRARVAAYHARI